ncbi:hypothetical protein B0H13DRAFT_1970587 [Mycena leptocephala]|nr:hypothetical protein B0H13DRAFT_1970587 [Mycena leptocephala]
MVWSVFRVVRRYELDLLMNDALGYNLLSPMNPTLGTLFVNKLIERSPLYRFIGGCI